MWSLGLLRVSSCWSHNLKFRTVLMRPGVAFMARGGETLWDRPYCSTWLWLQRLGAHLIRKVISSFTNHNLWKRARTASQLGARTQTSVCLVAAQQGADGKQSNLLQLSVFKRLRGQHEGESAPDGCLQVRRVCVGLGHAGEDGFRSSLTGLSPVGLLTGLTGVLVNWWKLWIAPNYLGIIFKCFAWSKGLIQQKSAKKIKANYGMTVDLCKINLIFNIYFSASLIRSIPKRHVGVCVGFCTCYILRTKIHIILTKWGHFWGLRTFYFESFEGQGLVLRLNVCWDGWD